MSSLLGTGSQRSGKNSRISIGTANTILKFARWTTNWRGDDLDTVNFSSAGKGEGLLGIDQVEISMGGDWDAARNSFDDPPGIYPRDDLKTVKLFENVIDNVGWSFPYMRVRSANNGTEVRGKVTFEASGMSQGTFTVPTGNA